MKRIFIIAAVMLMTVSAYAQSGKDIYNRYSGKKGVSAVYISPTMFGLMKELPDIQVEAGEVNLSSVIRTFDGMYILEVEDRALSDSLEAEISGLVGQGRFELLMEAAEESSEGAHADSTKAARKTNAINLINKQLPCKAWRKNFYRI